MEIIIASFCFTFYFVHVTNIPNLMKKILGIESHKRLKPFDCAVCLSVWCGAILYFAPIEVVRFIEFSFGSGVFMIAIKQYTKL